MARRLCNFAPADNNQTTENQRQEIERAGYKVEYWFADEGISGKVLASRPLQFAQLQQIRDGETLVVSKSSVHVHRPHVARG